LRDTEEANIASAEGREELTDLACLKWRLKTPRRPQRAP
jgi:hypothetical protein